MYQHWFEKAAPLRIAAVRPPAASTTAGLPEQEFPTEKVDRLVGAIEGKLNPTPTRGFIKDWLKTKAEEIAKARATNFLRERRTGLTGASLPGIGDILFYQWRGSERARLTRRTCRASAVREGNTFRPS